MKRLLAIVICVIFLIGCKQTSEHLVVAPDGSGSLKVNVFFPNATVQLLELLFGEDVRTMHAQMGAENKELKSLPQMTDEIFTKEMIQGKANGAGLKIDFLDFQNNKLDDGLQINYEIAFDDIEKLLKSTILSMQAGFSLNANGNSSFRIIPSVNKERETIIQIDNYKNFQQSEQFSSLEPENQEEILNAMASYQYTLTVSMPDNVIVDSSDFDPINENAARLNYYGNLLEDPTIVKKIAGIEYKEAFITWVAEVEEYSEEAEEPANESVSENFRIITLNNGETKEGELLEETDDYIKMKISDTTLTFYKDKIKSIE